MHLGPVEAGEAVAGLERRGRVPLEAFHFECLHQCCRVATAARRPLPPSSNVAEPPRKYTLHANLFSKMYRTVLAITFRHVPWEPMRLLLPRRHEPPSELGKQSS